MQITKKLDFWILSDEGKSICPSLILEVEDISKMVINYRVSCRDENQAEPKEV